MKERLTLDLLAYILSSDKRMIIFSHLLELTPMTNGELYDKFSDMFPELAQRRFFKNPYYHRQGRRVSSYKGSDIGEIIRGFANKKDYPKLVTVDNSRVMESSLTDLGSEAVPFIDFGLGFSYDQEMCLMKVFGYQKGGAPTVEVALNRTEILEFVAQSLYAVEIYDIAKRLREVKKERLNLGSNKKIKGLSPYKVLRHCEYMARGGAFDLDKRRPETAMSKDVFVYSTTPFSEDMDFIPLQEWKRGKIVNMVSRANAQATVDHLIQSFDEGSVLTLKDVFNYKDALKSDGARTYLRKFLEANGILTRMTYGSTLVTPTKDTRIIYNFLIRPINQALAEQHSDDNELPHRNTRIIEEAALMHRNNLKEQVTTVGLKFLEFYMH